MTENTALAYENTALAYENTITINKGMSNNSKFIIDKTLPIREQILANIGSEFVPYQHIIIFVSDSSELYSIHDLATVNETTLTMIYSQMSSLESYMYYKHMQCIIDKHNPKLQLVFENRNMIMENSVFGISDTEVKEYFYYFGDRFENHVRYILDGTDVELTKFQCVTVACNVKKELGLDHNTFFHVKVYEGPDPLRDDYPEHIIEASPVICDLLESNGYVMCRRLRYCGELPENKLTNVLYRNMWVEKEYIPWYLIESSDAFISPEHWQSWVDIVNEVEEDLYFKTGEHQRLGEFDELEENSNITDNETRKNNRFFFI